MLVMNMLDEDLRLAIAQIVPCTDAEGPGSRFAIWFQGCPLRCPGCCNPEFLSFTGGQSKTLAELVASLRAYRGRVEGITLLGGEPFAHAMGAAAIAGEARTLGLSVMVFTGYTLEQLRARSESAVGALLDRTDILVDGPYLRDDPDTERRWIGSRNQRIHFLTDRYQYDDQWRQRNTLEIRFSGGELSINGFPARNAIPLWKGWTKTKFPARTGPDAT